MSKRKSKCNSRIKRVKRKNRIKTSKDQYDSLCVLSQHNPFFKRIKDGNEFEIMS